MHDLPRIRSPFPPFSLFLAVASLAACQQQGEQSPKNDAASEPAVNLPAVPRPQPPIDRASLLAAVAEAASATAAGADIPESIGSLDGRQFEIRIRFGCRGPVTDLEDRWLGWSFDPEQRRIRVRAKPTISGEEPLVEGLGGERVEAVEGFWIPRPWLLLPVCPAGAAVTPPPATEPQAGGESNADRPPAQQQQRQPGNREAPELDPIGEPVPTAPRVGIAQFFTRDDPRSRRRDMRPYEARHKLAEGKAISSQGYNLVLAGRLRALPGTGVIHCSAQGPDRPPECVVSAEFQRVLIEKPDNREIIAQWGGG